MEIICFSANIASKCNIAFCAVHVWLLVQALYWINLELIAVNSFFADFFTSVGRLEHNVHEMYQIHPWKVTESRGFKTPGFLTAWKRGLEQILKT